MPPHLPFPFDAAGIALFAAGTVALAVVGMLVVRAVGRR